MPTRQIAYPNVNVEAAQGRDTEIQFLVPGSKFGNVVVILGPDQVRSLVAALENPFRAAPPSPEQEQQ